MGLAAHTGDHRRINPAPTSVLVFDVNETLLDIDTLGPYFERIFGDANVLRTWFGELVTYSMTLTLSGYYVDSFTLGRAVLHMVARSGCGAHRRRPELAGRGDADDAGAPRRRPGIGEPRAEGYRLVTLTNSPTGPMSFHR